MNTGERKMQLNTRKLEMSSCDWKEESQRQELGKGNRKGTMEECEM